MNLLKLRQVCHQLFKLSLHLIHSRWMLVIFTPILTWLQSNWAIIFIYQDLDAPSSSSCHPLCYTIELHLWSMLPSQLWAGTRLVSCIWILLNLLLYSLLEHHHPYHHLHCVHSSSYSSPGYVPDPLSPYVSAHHCCLMSMHVSGHHIAAPLFQFSIPLSLSHHWYCIYKFNASDTFFYYHDICKYMEK